MSMVYFGPYIEIPNITSAEQYNGCPSMFCSMFEKETKGKYCSECGTRLRSYEKKTTEHFDPHNLFEEVFGYFETFWPLYNNNKTVIVPNLPNQAGVHLNRGFSLYQVSKDECNPKIFYDEANDWGCLRRALEQKGITHAYGIGIVEVD